MFRTANPHLGGRPFPARTFQRCTSNVDSNHSIACGWTVWKSRAATAQRECVYDELRCATVCDLRNQSHRIAPMQSRLQAVRCDAIFFTWAHATILIGTLTCDANCEDGRTIIIARPGDMSWRHLSEMLPIPEPAPHAMISDHSHTDVEHKHRTRITHTKDLTIRRLLFDEPNARESRTRATKLLFHKPRTGA